ncbi:MAG: GrpB family protein, partial [Candidatus Nanoarchaeia archaeon]|nr:GrpB family protein [Candidatus Nanoarchaeia archaeon]
DFNLRLISKKLEKIGFQISPFKNLPKERPLRVGSITYENKKYLIHVHLTYYNSEDHKNILFFRDYLKNHKKLAKEYEQIKKRTVELGKVKAVEYNEQKSSFIKLILSRAK